ncbi:hypothetical protein cyc_02324 [Cyclospora cayetanensis]|uniref:Uncharacterized protein n=1 Tax=Cyclospora cayetanensis TaxID=88456 RepID=A0A1D3D6A1_9EIME|nr:hypothetical protein cyc_02324 [Cyclospora cayetanensis]
MARNFSVPGLQGEPPIPVSRIWGSVLSPSVPSYARIASILKPSLNLRDETAGREWRWPPKGPLSTLSRGMGDYFGAMPSSPPNAFPKDFFSKKSLFECQGGPARALRRDLTLRRAQHPAAPSISGCPRKEELHKELATHIPPAAEAAPPEAHGHAAAQQGYRGQVLAAAEVTRGIPSVILQVFCAAAASGKTLAVASGSVQTQAVGPNLMGERWRYSGVKSSANSNTCVAALFRRVRKGKRQQLKECSAELHAKVQCPGASFPDVCSSSSSELRELQQSDASLDSSARNKLHQAATCEQQEQQPRRHGVCCNNVNGLWTETTRETHAASGSQQGLIDTRKQHQEPQHQQLLLRLLVKHQAKQWPMLLFWEAAILLMASYCGIGCQRSSRRKSINEPKRKAYSKKACL